MSKHKTGHSLSHMAFQNVSKVPIDRQLLLWWPMLSSIVVFRCIISRNRQTKSISKATTTITSAHTHMNPKE